MKSASRFSAILRLIPACAALACTAATAAEIRVVAPNAVRETVVEVASQFERSTGHKVVISLAGTEAITKRVGEGEMADVVINAGQNIERLSTDQRAHPCEGHPIRRPATAGDPALHRLLRGGAQPNTSAGGGSIISQEAARHGSS